MVRPDEPSCVFPAHHNHRRPSAPTFSGLHTTIGVSTGAISRTGLRTYDDSCA